MYQFAQNESPLVLSFRPVVNLVTSVFFLFDVFNRVLALPYLYLCFVLLTGCKFSHFSIFPFDVFNRGTSTSISLSEIIPIISFIR